MHTHKYTQKGCNINCVSLKVKGEYGSLWNSHLTAVGVGRHLPYGITHCYLLPDRQAGWYLIYLHWNIGTRLS